MWGWWADSKRHVKVCRQTESMNADKGLCMSTVILQVFVVCVICAGAGAAGFGSLGSRCGVWRRVGGWVALMSSSTTGRMVT